MEILTTVLAGLLTASFAFIAHGVASYVRKRSRGPEEVEESYSERLAELTKSSSSASEEVDRILSELSRVARERQTAADQLDQDLKTLEGEEKQLKERIKMLESTPLPVAEHFASLLEPREARSARRDYLLFGAGVLATTVVAVTIALISGS